MIKVVVAAAFAAASSRGAQAVRLYANVLEINVRVWHVTSFRFPDKMASLSGQSRHDRIGRTAGICRE